MDAVEAVARALAGEEVWTGNNSLYPAMRDNWRERAKAALSAARPFIAAECAYIAEWSQYASPDEIATAIKETIR